jgi:DNA mismatch endonuclease (patch repair protein)
MVDRISPEQRSALMSRIRAKNTRPELIVRRLLHSLGYRFRLHRRDLPGTPDLAFPGRRKVVMIHGCFWHGHGCAAGQLPKSRPEFWAPKITANRGRDARNLRALRSSGWSVAVIWGCEMKDPEKVQARLVRFLGEPGGGKRSLPKLRKSRRIG